MMDKGAARILQRIETLASYSAIDYGVLRAYLTPEHRAAHDQLAVWMKEAGLETWQDEAGNQWGRKVSQQANAKTLIIGSHSDTVVDAGKYDGTLGVLMGIEALDVLQDVELPFHVDVVGFADEEGTRFNTTLLGSSAVAGVWQDSWWEIEDAQQISMAAAATTFGLDPANVKKAARVGDDLLGYLEVHIEQGPVLESLDLAVGVVTAIAGAKRYLFSLEGLAGHAGTVPISLRQDALCAVAEMVVFIEAFAKQHDIVATVGRLDIASAAVNVIPGHVNFSLDIRSQDQQQLEACCETLMTELDRIATARNVRLSGEKIYEASAAPCSKDIQHKWAQVVEDITHKPAKFLPSGAGHDAMVMANITDIGMLFMRCEKGISHNPRENVIKEDVATALDCLLGLIKTY